MQVIKIILLLLLTLSNSYAIEYNSQNISEFSNSSINTQDIPILNYEKGGLEDTAFAVNIHGVINNGEQQPYKTYVHQLEDFDNANVLAENPISNTRPYALAWNQEMTKIYGISRTNPRRLINISQYSGVATNIATFSGVLPNTSLSGIAIDENNICYIVATDNANHNTVSTLYECDLETAELTVVGTQSVAPDIHDITASCDGVIYGTDANEGALYSINKQTGDASLIGSLNTASGDYVLNVTYDRKSGDIYNYILDSVGYFTAFAKLNKETGKATYVSNTYKFGTFVGTSKSTCPEEVNTFNISPGLNGAWYEQETSGQGFLFDVYPESNTFFATWFTFDIDESESAEVTGFGAPEQKWFAASGPVGEGNTVELTIYSNSQGVFDDTAPVQTDAVGTMTVSFEDCSKGLIEYAFDDGDISGEIPITRIANDNVELCNSFSSTNK